MIVVTAESSAENEEIYLSIVIPFFNSFKSVINLLASIELGLPNIEVILVDDGSSDDSGSLIADAIRPYGNVRTIANHQNKGVSAARNQGMEAARGNYIWFVDSDDKVASGAVSTLVCFLHMQTKPFDVLFFGWSDADQGFEHVSEVVPLEMPFHDAIQRVYEGDGYVWNKVFSRTTLKRSGVRFDESVFWAEDKLFCAEFIASAKGRFFRIDNCLYIHIKHSGSFTSSKSADQKHLSLLKAECKLVHLARSFDEAELLIIAENQLVRDSLMLMMRLFVERPKGWRSQFDGCWNMISRLQYDDLSRKRLPIKYRGFLLFCKYAKRAMTNPSGNDR